MPAIKLLCHLAVTYPPSLSKEERLMLEANFFSHTCQELKETYKSTYKEYFHHQTRHRNGERSNGN